MYASIRLPPARRFTADRIGRILFGDRQALGKITKRRVFIEQLEHNPARFMPEIDETKMSGHMVKIDLNSADEGHSGRSLETSRQDPSLTQRTIIVARDLAHAKIRERLENGGTKPEYIKTIRSTMLVRPRLLQAMHPDHSDRRPPDAWTLMSTSSSPLADRWSCGQGQSLGGRTEACKNHGWFLPWLHRRACRAPGTGLHQACGGHRVSRTRHGSVWKIEVEDFPAFIVIDDKGNDFFKELNLG